MMTRRERIYDLLGKAFRVARGFARTNMDTHASSTAFYFFSSLIPMIIIYACFISYSSISPDELIQIILAMVPDVLDGFVEPVLREAFDSSGLAFSVSFVTLLLTASQGVRALAKGLNAAYGVEENRNAIQLAIVSVIWIVTLILLLSAAVYLIFSDGVTRALSTFLPDISRPDAVTTLLRTAVLFVAGVIGFALCYTYLPAGTRRFREQVPGALLAACAWFVFSFGFRVYVDHSNRFTLIYGSLATVALFLFWLYCIFVILLGGGFLNRCLKVWAQESQRQPEE